MLPSLKVPTGVSWTVVPRAIEGLAGFSEIEASAAGRTVNVVLPVTVP